MTSKIGLILNGVARLSGTNRISDLKAFVRRRPNTPRHADPNINARPVSLQRTPVTQGLALMGCHA